MFKFLTNKGKFLYFAFGILMFVVLLGSLVYMTQYAHVHVYFTRSATGAISFAADTEDALHYSNQILYDFFAETTDQTFASDFNQYARTVYDFQIDMSAFDNLILIFAIIGLICFAGLLVLSNHSRRVYYKSNLYGGIVFPAVTAIFSVVMIIKNTMLMGVFSKNYELFNRVSVLQNPELKSAASKETDNIAYLKDLYSCNTTTYIIFDILFALVFIYSLFLIAYSIYRYKECAEKRSKIIEKAVMSND